MPPRYAIPGSPRWHIEQHAMICERIEASRREIGVGSRELCELAGLSSGAVSSLETGRAADVTLGTLRSLALALGVDLAWLVTGRRSVEESSENEMSEDAPAETSEPCQQNEEPIASSTLAIDSASMPLD